MAEQVVESVETEETHTVEETPEEAKETDVQEEPVETEEEATEETAEETEEVQPPKRKQTAQERIDEITRLRRQEEREKEYWKRIALEKSKETPQKQVPEQQVQLPKRPALENFETQESYEDALFEWRDECREITTRNHRARTENQEAVTTFNAKAKTLRDEHPDFDEAIEAPVFSPMMRTVLLRAEHGPETAYFLGKPENRETAERILSLSPELQIYELGRLETNLQMAKKTKKVTTAPKPIKPVGMSGTTESEPSKMSTEEWMKWDRERTIKKIKESMGGP